MPAHQPLAPETLEAFDSAQRSAIRILGDAIGRLTEGQSEVDVVALLTQVAGDHGFHQWFHEPHVRFGGGFSRIYRASGERVLRPGTLVEIDLGPANDTAYGDVGVALAWGTAEEPRLVSEARDLCRAVCGFASRWKTVGELFVFASGWTNNHRRSLGDSKAVGHVCLPREGLVDMAWPTAAHAATLLRRNQVQWYNPRRMAGAYAIRPRLVHGDLSLAFEEMIYVDGDVKRVLGRDSAADIGTW